MNDQRPTAPALSLPITQPDHPIVALPDRSATWQRSYATAHTPPPVLATPASSWTHSQARDYRLGNIVYSSLQRPKLLRGGEWWVSMYNNLLSAGLTTLAFVTWNWRLLLGAIFFAWPVQWLIRMLARHDPQWLQIYFLTRQRPLIREPHGYAADRPAPPPRILPRLRKFVA